MSDQLPNCLPPPAFDASMWKGDRLDCRFNWSTGCAKDTANACSTAPVIRTPSNSSR